MYKNILITTAADKNSNIVKKIEVAKALADDDGQITIISVMERIPPYVAPSLPSDYEETTTQRMQKAISQKIGNHNYKITVLSGHAAHQVLKFAKKNDIDCIIVSSHRPGFQDYFMGSTALTIVRQAECSVTVVR
ncbi:universal stress protein [Halomonas halocynthiae]|uniref:universal stress protein n=1 Tax=Halomonas halocynthiae TaxID=176290 RepID=UPI000486BC6D|nr:universal stress protein [Halomonas halocynthiae]